MASINHFVCLGVLKFPRSSFFSFLIGSYISFVYFFHVIVEFYYNIYAH